MNSKKIKLILIITPLIVLFSYFFTALYSFHQFHKGIYYNDKNMEIFAFLKSLLLFFITFSQIFYTSINLPHRDYFCASIFKSFFFGFFKLSINALDCYVAIEALTFSYKLMNYIKVNGNGIKTFIKFYLFSLPKIFSFLVICPLSTSLFSIISVL